jgi:DNA polymerase-3 subunit gamma/tau
MLTKEAFNALLKTLEEPPPKVMFFFATTEPHKVLPTIVSRCQRFNLNRIPQHLIVIKLRRIVDQLGATAEDEALRLLAQRAEGGLRDAESLLDQILAFEEGPVTVDSVASILGLMTTEIYFEIDRAGKEGRFLKAFEIANQIFSEGKNLLSFIEGLIGHLRHILLIKTAGIDSPLISLLEEEKKPYLQASKLYTHEQCLTLIEYLLESQTQLRTTSFGKYTLEAILLHVMQSHFRIPIEHLVRRLSELEKSIIEKSEETPPPKGPQATNYQAPPPPKITAPPLQTSVSPKPPTPPSPPLPSFNHSVSEDPTPSRADLGKSATVKAAPPKKSSNEPTAKIVPQTTATRPQHEYDTLLHFAAVELEGKLQKH